MSGKLKSSIMLDVRASLIPSSLLNIIDNDVRRGALTNCSSSGHLKIRLASAQGVTDEATKTL